MVSDILYTVIAAYCFAILGSYLVLTVISTAEIIKYCRRRKLIDSTTLHDCPFLPSVAIIAPAYNEEVTIIPNIRSLLSLHYSNLTVIVVNDGSKDNTLAWTIEAYSLVKVDYPFEQVISTKPVRGIYKSTNPAFSKLLVVDKENGGKADAINVGVNIANQSDYFACIDVDCILEPDSMLKMVEPIMQSKEHRIVAVGGIVWLTNDAVIEEGKVIKIKTPESFIARIQVIEYFRAFLLGRTTWAWLDGLLLISGAFGIFERKVVLEVGGYNHHTVGEDMELVMRIHMLMRERKEKYRVSYVPDPLCWTEAPGNYKILSKQRQRWTRGTIECLLFHRKMFFNPRYGVLGVLSYPYWFCAEWLAPFFETGGLLFVLIATLFGIGSWKIFLALFGLIYVYSLFISFFSIFAQEISYQTYSTSKDALWLFLTALIEPFYYHPRTVKWALKANLNFFRGKKQGWGEMTRAGFAKKPGT